MVNALMAEQIARGVTPEPTEEPETFLLQAFAGSLGYQVTPEESTWQHAAESASTRKHLKTFWTIQHPGASRSMWEHVGTSGNIWEHLGTSGNRCDRF